VAKQFRLEPRRMTPATARAIVVEYRFRCFCGAPIVTTEKTVTCVSCGQTLEHYASTLPVRRIEKHKQQPVSSSYTGSLGRSTPRRHGRRDFGPLIGLSLLIAPWLILLVAWVNNQTP